MARATFIATFVVGLEVKLQNVLQCKYFFNYEIYLKT